MVILRDLQTRVAAASVDDEKEVSFLVAVDFDEMVAATERTEAFFEPPLIQFGIAAKLLHVQPSVTAVRPFAHVPSVRDVLADERIQLRQVETLFFEFDHVHPTADVDADDVRDDAVADRHGGADGTALAGVDVRHDTDLTAGGKRLVAHGFDLPLGGGFEFLCEHFCGGVFAFDLNHNIPPSFQDRYIRAGRLQTARHSRWQGARCRARCVRQKPDRAGRSAL